MVCCSGRLAVCLGLNANQWSIQFAAPCVHGRHKSITVQRRATLPSVRTLNAPVLQDISMQPAAGKYCLLYCVLLSRSRTSHVQNTIIFTLFLHILFPFHISLFHRLSLEMKILCINIYKFNLYLYVVLCT